MHIKMCGMMSFADVDACLELGVDAVGLVVEYPVPVPWNLSRDTARALVRRIGRRAAAVAVCSGTPEALFALARDVHPDALQVHGDETLDETEEIVRLVASLGVKVYRALRVSPTTGEAAGEIADPVRAARAIEGTGVAGLVVDAKVARRPGGTGVRVDADLIRRVVGAVSIPVIAAGGLTPANVKSVIDRARPHGVDVLTGVEDTPGQKNRTKMEAFVKAARKAWGLPAPAGFHDRFSRQGASAGE